MANELEQLVLKKAQSWLDGHYDEATKKKVKYLMDNDMKELVESFYKDLEFGTGGLRGIMGVGTNRMNVYTVGMATQGLANYLKKAFPGKQIKVAIGHDSRNNSRLFSERVADIFAANGFKVYLFDSLRPTPELSFAIRKLECDSGVVITASHNPKEYNGYKAYWNDGAQVVAPHDKNIIAEVQKITSPDQVLTNGHKDNIVILDETFDAIYLDAVHSLSLSPEAIAAHHDLKIVYTPIHGTGVILVPESLRKFGFTNVVTVKEQNIPDGNFPTVASPNPEERATMKMAIDLAARQQAEIVLATDPDADRVGIAMKCPDGSYELVSGNEMGALLLDYICAGRIEKGTMPKNPVAVKSIVSTPLADAIAAHYGVEMRSVLTGFKWIGDQIANLEAAGEVDRFIFGFEESYGYLAGPYVRDKDAVIGSMLICEMAAYYRSIGSSIKQRLEEIYAQYGRYLNKVDSFEFPGLTGMEKMASIMQKLRDEPLTEIGGHKVVKVTDYKKPEETGLPAANVLIYTLENGATVVVRPSGTEPKIKTYFTTLGKTLEEAQAQKDALAAAIEPILK